MGVGVGVGLCLCVICGCSLCHLCELLLWSRVCRWMSGCVWYVEWACVCKCFFVVCSAEEEKQLEKCFDTWYTL